LLISIKIAKLMTIRRTFSVALYIELERKRLAALMKKFSFHKLTEQHVYYF